MLKSLFVHQLFGQWSATCNDLLINDLSSIDVGTEVVMQKLLLLGRPTINFSLHIYIYTYTHVYIYIHISLSLSLSLFLSLFIHIQIDPKP